MAINVSLHCLECWTWSGPICLVVRVHKSDFHSIIAFSVAFVVKKHINSIMKSFVPNKMLNWFSPPVMFECISAAKRDPLYCRRCWCKFSECQAHCTNVKTASEDFLATLLRASRSFFCPWSLVNATPRYVNQRLVRYIPIPKVLEVPRGLDVVITSVAEQITNCVQTMEKYFFKNFVLFSKTQHYVDQITHRNANKLTIVAMLSWRPNTRLSSLSLNQSTI